MIETPSSRSDRQRSPDGMWEWNGAQWIPIESAPASPPQTVVAAQPSALKTLPSEPPSHQRSSDGNWEWNGIQWIPTHDQSRPQPVEQTLPQVPTAALAPPTASTNSARQFSPAGQWQ